MRGKDSYKNIDKTNARITPAHAGKSDGVWEIPDYPQDHPRTCGEKDGGIYPYDI